MAAIWQLGFSGVILINTAQEMTQNLQKTHEKR